jgi:putative effector of murein hydrolase LrgA (UPF0299 family)
MNKLTHFIKQNWRWIAVLLVVGDFVVMALVAWFVAGRF